MLFTKSYIFQSHRIPYEDNESAMGVYIAINMTVQKESDPHGCDVLRQGMYVLRTKLPIFIPFINFFLKQIFIRA